MTFFTKCHKTSLIFPPVRNTRGVARTKLQEMQSYGPKRLTFFPDNGRTFADAALSTFLATLTNGEMKEDKVGRHGDLLAEFLYLEWPHNC